MVEWQVIHCRRNQWPDHQRLCQLMELEDQYLKLWDIYDTETVLRLHCSCWWQFVCHGREQWRHETGFRREIWPKNSRVDWWGTLERRKKYFFCRSLWRKDLRHWRLRWQYSHLISRALWSLFRDLDDDGGHDLCKEWSGCLDSDSWTFLEPPGIVILGTTRRPTRLSHSIWRLKWPITWSL